MFKNVLRYLGSFFWLVFGYVGGFFLLIELIFRVDIGICDLLVNEEFNEKKGSESIDD